MNQTNRKSVISLTLGILSILIPLIGLILGIIGVVFSRKAAKEIAFSNEFGSFTFCFSNNRRVNILIIPITFFTKTKFIEHR